MDNRTMISIDKCVEVLVGYVSARVSNAFMGDEDLDEGLTELIYEAAENNIACMKKSLENAMRACNKIKFKTELFSFGIQKNPPSVKFDDEHLELIPIEYLIPQDPKVDKKRILEDLKSGAKFDWATMEQGESLRIR